MSTQQSQDPTPGPDPFKDKAKEKEDESGRRVSMTGNILQVISYSIFIYLCFGAYIEMNKEYDPVAAAAQNPLGIGGPWTLYDPDGKPFGSDDLAGSYYIIMFGYSQCPDICPNTLNRLKNVMNVVKESWLSSLWKLKVVFVTVDPDRDSGPILQSFVKRFNPDFIGLRAASEKSPEMKHIMKMFKVYANKINLETNALASKNAENYGVDHTSVIYLIDDQGLYVSYLPPIMDDKELGAHVLDLMKERKKQQYQFLFSPLHALGLKNE
jgi:cytochrome oxidase Cu insertion factor (SCO1/SenC/PrrC family)